MNRMASEIQSVAAECIRIRGARMHNLQNIDLDIPRDRFVVITGPSGSGKSSLAFDTLYAEGQRQYIESLSTYARQFLHQLERPDVDLIEGLQPTISIDQRAGSHNPRSTVATVTEIYDYLRLLFARLGEARCYQCGEPIRQQTPEQILDALLELSAGTRVMILAPLVRGRKGEHKDVLESIRKLGFLRARVDGQVIDVNSPPALVAQKSHNIEAVIDRVVVREGVRERIAESINLAVQHGDGLVLATHEEKTAGGSVWHDRLFSTQYACPNCKISYEELEPRTFSFNSPYGACPKCEGLGSRVAFDPELVLPDAGLSLAAGAIAPWKGETPAALRKHQNHLRPLLDQGRHPLEHAAGKTHAQAPRPIAARRGQAVPRRAGDAGKGVRHDHQRAEAAAARGLPRRGGVQGVRRHAAAARGPLGPRGRQGDPRSHGADGRRRAAVLPRARRGAARQPISLRERGRG